MANNFATGSSYMQLPSNGMADRQRQDQQTWNQMINMISMANNTDPQTLLGYGLGRLIRGAIDHRNAMREYDRSMGYDDSMADQLKSLDKGNEDLTAQLTTLQRQQPGETSSLFGEKAFAQPTDFGIGTGAGALGYGRNDINQNPLEAVLAERYPALGQNQQGYFPMPDNTPKDGKDTVNQALRDGMQQGYQQEQINQLNQQIQQNRAQREQLLSRYAGADMQNAMQQRTQIANSFLSQMGQVKQLYETAERQNNQEGMDYAAQAANALRAQAAQAGVDMSGTESMSSQQILQAMAKNEMDYLNNSISPQEYQKMRYGQLRINGMAPSQAKAMAESDAAAYAESMQKSATTAMQNYGFSNRGEITRDGFMAMMKMAQFGNGDMANALANMFPGPKEAYAFGNQKELAADKQAYDERSKAIDYDYKTKGAYRDAEIKQQFMQLDAQIKEAQKDRDFARSKQLEEYKAQLKATYGGSGGAGSGSGDKDEKGKTKSDRYKALKDWITMYENRHKNDEDDVWKSDPEYLNRLDEMSRYTTPEYDFNDARSMETLLTDLLEAREGDGSPKYNRTEIENTMRDVTDMADSLLSGVDWEAWHR